MLLDRLARLVQLSVPLLVGSHRLQRLREDQAGCTGGDQKRLARFLRHQRIREHGLHVAVPDQRERPLEQPGALQHLLRDVRVRPRRLHQGTILADRQGYLEERM